MNSPANMMYGKLASHQCTKNASFFGELTSNYRADMTSTVEHHM